MNSVELPDGEKPNQACQICGNAEGNRIHIAREMMLGLRDSFPYLECGSCGCVQIREIPKDMARYYPASYYSFDTHGTFTTFLRRCRVSHAFGRFNPIGWLLTELVVPHDAILAVRRSKVAKDAAILDVGCGSGRLLLDLAWLGFSNLTGVDPFVSRDLTYPCGVKVFQRQVQELEGHYDLIMLHHSFEHMAQPGQVMQAVQKLLNPGGQVIIRIPVADSYAWRTYGINWVNLDAPRHFFLHTRTSMKLLTTPVGLQLLEARHEGNAEQFWASEQYADQIAMSDSRSMKRGVFPRLKVHYRLIRDKKRSNQLNLSGAGDMVCFRFNLLPQAKARD